MNPFNLRRTIRVLGLGMVSIISASVMAGLDASAPGAKPAVPSQSLEFNQKMSLVFSVPEKADVQPITIERSTITRLTPGMATDAWRVTAAGTEVSNVRGERMAFINALTSGEVRPHVVVDTARGAVWLYGEGLYRYRAATGELERFNLVQRTLGAIRTVVADAMGVWLVAEKGVAAFDDTSGKLSLLRHPLLNGQQIVRAVALDGALWLVSQPLHFVKVMPSSTGDVQLSASQHLPLGVTAEMLVANGKLWMLSSYKNGDSYQLAFVSPRDNVLSVVAGKVYSLRAQQGKLLATTYRDLYTIDPGTLMVATSRIDAVRSITQLTQSGQVLFVGSSYGVKDNCEVVEHRRADLSKGWLNPGLGLYAPVRMSATSEAR